LDYLVEVAKVATHQEEGVGVSCFVYFCQPVVIELCDCPPSLEHGIDPVLGADSSICVAKLSDKVLEQLHNSEG